MPVQTAAQLVKKTCAACEGDVCKLSPTTAKTQVVKLHGWRLTDRGKQIRKEWVVKDFAAGIDFFKRVAELAESEGHHPDLHLEGYRNVSIEISTHSIGGLSENDFILAAKIDKIPVKLKKG